MNQRLAFALAACLLAGCSGSKHESVQWYVDHRAEREAKLKWCGDDAARAIDVDCLNANKANEQALLHGGAPTAGGFQFNPGAAGAAAGAGAASQASAGAAAVHGGGTAADSFTFDPSKAAPKGGK
jgi:outer membrane lipoprotein SlyB